QHPIAARTHVHMGVVILEGFKNRELGEKQFAEALAIEPAIAMTPALATPEINDAFDEAKAQLKNGGGTGHRRGAAARRSAVRAPGAQARRLVGRLHLPYGQRGEAWARDQGDGER